MNEKFCLQTFNCCSDNQKSKACPERSRRIKNRKWVGNLAICVAFVFCGALAQAQQRSGNFRVGVLEPGDRPRELTSRTRCNSSFREGVRELGWIEGQNLRIEERHGEFKPDRLRELAAELVRMAPDVIWTHSPPAVHAAKQATNSIPIVIGVASDLVEQGIVAGTLARPGGNITGMELRDLEIMGKRLELLKQAVRRPPAWQFWSIPPTPRMPGFQETSRRRRAH
jgi:putative ABC transport system substrate-binding protein